jgi:hypothetical protein
MTVLNDISSREVARNGLRWVTGLAVVRLKAATMRRPFSGSQVALSAVTDFACGRRILVGCDRSNRSGLGCFLPWPIRRAA